jgi:hypothetical protein
MLFQKHNEQMRIPMKNLLKITLMATLSWNTLAFAGNEENPMAHLRANLDSTLTTVSGSNLEDLKAVANDKNTDIEIAFQNYLIAKKRVSVARAAFNPVTTGNLLGLALGLNYLWVAVAVEAVTSIPTKMYNVSSNKYLAKAALYNSYEAKLALTNELSHLYYDILTHEVILKSIDQELAILLYHQGVLAGMKNVDEPTRINKANIVGLKIERLDIYNLYVEEVAALKTLLSMAPAAGLKLTQVKTEIDHAFLDDLKQDKLEELALVNSNTYKTAINIRHAAEANVKSVQWSILSFNGLNSSYKSRVKDAKLSAEGAASEQENSELQIRNKVLMSLNGLDSSLRVLDNYSSIYGQSIGLSEDFYNLYVNGSETEGAAFETSISAIRDFRNKVAAHYVALSSLDDLSKNANFSFELNSKRGSAQAQMEASPFYDLSESDFKVVRRKDSEKSFNLLIESDRNNIVKKVEYSFDNLAFPNQVSDRDTKDFYATFIKNDFSPLNYQGVARVELTNGHELEIKFKF